MGHGNNSNNWIMGNFDSVSGNKICTNADAVITPVTPPHHPIKREGENVILKDLIVWLEQQDANAIVTDGFGSPHSDRGWYEKLGFSPVEKTTFGDMLTHTRSALGATFQGYKGGDYTMDEWTDCLIGEYGTCGEEITSAHLKLWLLTARKNA
jgi:hypothetical protein